MLLLLEYAFPMDEESGTHPPTDRDRPQHDDRREAEARGGSHDFVWFQMIERGLVGNRARKRIAP